MLSKTACTTFPRRLRSVWKYAFSGPIIPHSYSSKEKKDKQKTHSKTNKQLLILENWILRITFCPSHVIFFPMKVFLDIHIFL